ncbi:MAG TPA: molybdopterin dinucleotide binding domain-containing protein, partial [Longimicrobiaceae bacterium]|nr:molybdopterin dinucleotide binding domain-containing protein [Longimicrobiaceae bacterium]
SYVERITGIPEATRLEVAGLIGSARSVMVLTGRGPEQQSQGVNNAAAYINLALAVGAVGRPFSGYGCLTGQGNGQGGREHGQKADQLPGYRDIRDPAARRHLAEMWNVAEESIPGAGLSAQEMFATLGTEGGVRALLVLGANPLLSAADSATVEGRLRSLDLLVVADFFLSETARLADVVLPAAQWAEEDGTMTNLEGRVIRRRRAFPPPVGVRTDLEIITGLAEKLGLEAGFSFAGPEQVFEELRRATAGGRADYSGITYTRIDREGGVFWPCRSENEPGEARLFAERFPTPTGRARFSAVGYRPTAEEPDDEYPFFLTTGRLLAHYQTGTQTRRVERLRQMAPSAAAQIHPETARRYGISDRSEVILATRRGQARFNVELSPRLRADTIFVPLHWGEEASANRLTNPLLDPISRMPEFKVCAVRIERVFTSEGARA